MATGAYCSLLATISLCAAQPFVQLLGFPHSFVVSNAVEPLFFLSKKNPIISARSDACRGSGGGALSGIEGGTRVKPPNMKEALYWGGFIILVDHKDKMV